MFDRFPREEGFCYEHKFVCQYEEKEKILDVILDSLYSKNVDLIRGDLLDLFESTYVFDGCKIVDLYDDNIIPSQFTVINNNVPLHYWSSISDVMWFDHSTVKEQCIKNIDLAHIGILTTTFIYNNIEYLVIYETDDFADFQNLLQKDILKLVSGKRHDGSTCDLLYLCDK